MNKKDIVQYIKHKFSLMETEKEYMNPLFDGVGSHVNLRYERQSGQATPGEFTTSKIWDTTAVKSAQLMAASILNAIFPNAKTSLVLRPKEFITNNRVVKEYFNKVNAKFTNYLNNPRTNLYSALTEVMLDAVIFGTPSLYLNKKEDADYFTEIPITYKSMPLKELYIYESNKEIIDTIYYKIEYTIQQLVNKYGLENVSQQVSSKYNSSSPENLSEKVYVIQAIEPAINVYKTEKTPSGKKYSSIHMEEATSHLLKESGFDDLPVIPVRMDKRSSEVWGRSPSINALSDIFLANILAESISMATEKNLDPPLGVFSNSVLGNNINTSAGGITPISNVGGGVSNPIFPIYTVGDFKSAYQLLLDTKQNIQSHYYLDWLFDMGAQRERTLGEVNVQNDLRGRALGSIYARLETELIVPVVEKTFNFLFNLGWFGCFKGDAKYEALVRAGVPLEAIQIIPEELKLAKSMQSYDEVAGTYPTNFYDIEIISPAARMRNREELNGMVGFLQTINGVFQIMPESLDGVNLNNFIKRVAVLLGTDVELLNSDDVIKEIKQMRAMQMQQQSQMEAAEAQSKIKRDNAMADSMTAATVTKLGMGGMA